VNLGIQDCPFNAYYHGFGINSGYTYHFNNTHAWELINATYFFTFDKSLTTQLAQNFNVNPDRINRIEYQVMTNGVFDLTKGKFVLLKDYIRYFSSSLVYGLGAIKTKSDTSFAANFGFKFAVLMSNSFLWSFELRDALAFSGFTNYVTLGLVGGYTF
jgi:outer membrane beta-barrel protein